MKQQSSQQAKRGRGRPPGSPNRKKRRPPSRPSSTRLRRPQHTSSATEQTTSAEESASSIATSSISSAATGAETIEERAAAFETIAATVPDVVGSPEAIAGAVLDDAAINDAAEASLRLEGQVVLDHATVRFYLKFGFETAARMLKEKRWELTAEELQSATPVTHDLVAKLMPWFLGTSAYKEEIAFALVMFGIVGPRLPLLKKPTSTDGTATPGASAFPDTAKAI